MSNHLYELGRWAYRHHRRVTALWLAAAVLLGLAALGLGTGTKNSFEIPGTESQTAIDSLGRTFPQLSGAGAYLIVIAPKDQSIEDPRARDLIEGVVKKLESVDGVTTVMSPYSKLSPIAISPDHRSAMVQIQFKGAVTDLTADQLEAMQRTDKTLVDAGYDAHVK